MSEHGDALGPGTRIGNFEIVEELRAGGFGITYLARDLKLPRRVAIKEYAPRDWATRRFDGTIGPRSSSARGDYEWGLGALRRRSAVDRDRSERVWVGLGDSTGIGGRSVPLTGSRGRRGANWGREGFVGSGARVQ